MGGKDLLSDVTGKIINNGGLFIQQTIYVLDLRMMRVRRVVYVCICVVTEKQYTFYVGYFVLENEKIKVL